MFSVSFFEAVRADIEVYRSFIPTPTGHCKDVETVITEASPTVVA